MDELNEIKIEEQPNQYKPPTQFQLMFDKMTNDMKFVGMFTIVYGVITCLTIVGALIGIPTIIIGMRIRESAEQFYMYRLTNNPASLKLGFEIQGKYFRIIKILIIIGLIFMIIYFAFIIYLFTTFSSFFMTPNFEAS
ncbi:MAG: DUF5362 domain-containing protein [Melioribacteraceae bacterium]|nr:DUF5362 domain-containing protein [Melioribacteraceae bacterium]